MAAPRLKPTLEDYLALEAASDTKHEFVDGEIYAMAGASRPHNHVTAGFVGELRSSLLAKGCGCVAYGSDMRVQVDETTNLYPDALVLCPPIEGPDAMSVTNPVVVVEVQSPSTGSWDLSGKRDLYARLPSVQHYLVAHVEAWRVEHFRRLPDGSWRVTVHGPDDAIDLDAVGVTVSVAAVYAGLDAVGGAARDAVFRGRG